MAVVGAVGHLGGREREFMVEIRFRVMVTNRLMVVGAVSTSHSSGKKEERKKKKKKKFLMELENII
ncbi:conserved hypothetical protein [Ricinus communis]|uniref:Uncharacterized protein n=1 Tax=Ricinus communis TaxID=3988 RepID=B9R6Q3_RICCO|nr:conserved hypothetical protein [Ricinus communis]